MDNRSSISSEFNFEIDLPEKRDPSTIYRLNLIKYHRQPELANLVMENSSEGLVKDFKIFYSCPIKRKLEGGGGRCDEASPFPLTAKSRCRKTSGNCRYFPNCWEEIRNCMVKDLDSHSQAVPSVKKRRRNIMLSFSHDSVTTARLKTYKVHRAIGAKRARDKMGLDREGRPKNKRSKKELGGERREVYKESERARR
ncbi:hypothetical protein TNCV_3875551 [Trichonephila clavipes]|uniref:Uncharacterized protein n=1 Tax=Trichonephila clavipes TaxID=2585209 RepID=A0A8X6T0H6_TRICX|nr:hypothetical protein TNCV_3875551 [Trichonephila clavipes]